jgi:ABC-2 type transport system permease protein
MVGLMERLHKELSRALAIGWKDMKTYYLTPPTLMFGVLFPIALFFTFTVGRNLGTQQLLPILVSQTVFWASSTVGPVVIPLERRTKTFDRYLSAPMSLMSVLIGKMLAGVFFGIIVSVIPLLVGIYWLSATIADLFALILGLVLSCIAFAAMGIMFASIPTESVGNIMMPLNFVRIPMLFISGVFIPIEDLPFVGQLLAYFSPLTHTLILIRTGLNLESFSIALGISALALILVSLAFLYVSFWFHEITKKRE